MGISIGDSLMVLLSVLFLGFSMHVFVQVARRTAPAAIVSRAYSIPAVRFARVYKVIAALTLLIVSLIQTAASVWTLLSLGGWG